MNRKRHKMKVYENEWERLALDRRRRGSVLFFCIAVYLLFFECSPSLFDGWTQWFRENERQDTSSLNEKNCSSWRNNCSPDDDHHHLKNGYHRAITQETRLCRTKNTLSNMSIVFLISFINVINDCSLMAIVSLFFASGVGVKDREKKFVKECAEFAIEQRVLCDIFV